MDWERTSTVDHLPEDPVGEVVAATLVEIFQGASVELVYSPDDAPLPDPPTTLSTTSTTGDGPAGWRITCTLRLRERLAGFISAESSQVLMLFHALPGAAMRASARFRDRHHEPRRSIRPPGARCATRSSSSCSVSTPVPRTDRRPPT